MANARVVSRMTQTIINPWITGSDIVVDTALNLAFLLLFSLSFSLSRALSQVKSCAINEGIAISSNYADLQNVLEKHSFQVGI